MLHLNKFRNIRPQSTFCMVKTIFRTYSIREAKEEVDKKDNLIEKLVAKYEWEIKYSSYVEQNTLKLGYKKTMGALGKLEQQTKILKDSLLRIQPLPLSLKYVTHLQEEKPAEIAKDEQETEPVTSFPYNIDQNHEVQETPPTKIEETHQSKRMRKEIEAKYAMLKDMQNWMTAYDNFEKTTEESDVDVENWEVNYGTPDPESSISNVPCGGCGALLHCKDTAIPGYIPSEIYKNNNKAGAASLESIICQRCYFLKNYNLALQVRVSPDDYPKILTTIQNKRALVVLMVDLMDFPCSIWPGIADILGPRTPIIIVGNKVDLIPKDADKYLTRIKRTLLDYCKLSGFGTTNIKDVVLISAKTGYGIEELITRLQSVWKHKGDVYLTGCTNVGKSTLFNILLQSDYCKIQAADLIQRATTSLWPGTTLNLLKFPITRPSGYRLMLRHSRLFSLRQIEKEEAKLRSENLSLENTAENATLIGHIERSYDRPHKDADTDDYFSMTMNANASGRLKLGINEEAYDYKFSKWCFDTPGVVQPDQILHLLTTDELMFTLPRELIRPETFCVKPGTTIYIAGLGRLDYIEGKYSVRLTVFRSKQLPLIVCDMKEAENIYQDCLGTDLMKVPIDSGDRLSKWPGLELAREFIITGIDPYISSKDVVLSSAGWIAVNCAPGENFKFAAWTPEKRGCYVRDCLLPEAVKLRGQRIRRSVAYKKNKLI